MPPLAGTDLFLLGLASGLALLAMSSYRHASPGWLRWLLLGCGLALIFRYVCLAQFATAATFDYLGLGHRIWLVGLMLPGIFAVDQLLRDPRMSPRILLIRSSPLLIAYAALLIAPTELRRLFVLLIQGTFAAGFAGWAGLIAWKVPSLPIRRTLAGLVGGYAWLALSGAGLKLYPEIFTWLALWYAYETAFKLQQSSQSLS
ncbi:MAG: hypothetical protein COV75_03950 [Candidatus Omnitrophica bacterium CG11_big_fil_rev_8_21_14_0_20_63_9]|nr:MAG: hypothetical protein COV75_03950 [Candidatus Omnitrophica bacterium CG11_big_fil_rev_8_21_14_0_20_63_9]